MVRAAVLLLASVFSMVLILTWTGSRPAHAQSAKQCKKSCTKQKKACEKGFKQVLRNGKAECAQVSSSKREKKTCQKAASKAFKNNKKECKRLFKAECKPCCQGDFITECSVTLCGDTVISGPEQCDDGNAVSGDGCDANCTVTGCGNGVVTSPEQCDDGNTASGDGCDANCAATSCGNAVVTGGEACDDGNPVDGDGCDSNCTLTGCGNGVVTAGEGCDDGNAAIGDGCDSNCTATGCGNGIVTSGEQCDDGNTTDTDACRNDCTLPGCGDGVQDPGEGCDDGNAVDGDGCDTNCTPTGCGNGIMTSGEECDNGAANSDVAPDACRTDCTLASCGDGVKDAGEECDDGNLDDDDGCDTLCMAACGNGNVDPGEECDDGNEIEADGCTTACTLCGNESTTPPEECDDGRHCQGGRNAEAMCMDDSECESGNCALQSGDGCDANCTVTGCGNSIVTLPETCDDGNTSNLDNCPSDCIIDACTPETGTDRTVSVNLSSSSPLTAVTLFLDYPEGQVNIPGSGANIPPNIVELVPFLAQGVSNDLNHALRQVVLGAIVPFSGGELLKIHFEDCDGAPPPVTGAFTCAVLEARNTSNQLVSGVTCSVSGVPVGTTTTATTVLPTTTTSTTVASTTTTSSTVVPTTTTSTTAAPTTTTSTTAAPTTTTSTTATPTTTTSTTAAPTTTTTTTTTLAPTTTTTTSTTTTTTTEPTTTTTTSTTTTTTVAACPVTTTTIPALCGNGEVDPGETCDDGPSSLECSLGPNDGTECSQDADCGTGKCFNPQDNDSCPADCVIDACTQDLSRNITYGVEINGNGSPVGSVTVLFDWPEGMAGLRFIPGLTIKDFPLQPFFPILGNLGHAFRIGGAQSGGIPGAADGVLLANFVLDGCAGQPLPDICDVRCVVLDASDTQSNGIDSVTCRVVEGP